jgi:hypothetical protein
MKIMGSKNTHIEQDMKILLRVLGEAHASYAIIGGMAIVFHGNETRYTKDIDVAMKSVRDLPAKVLEEAGFRRIRSATGFIKKWRGPFGTPIDFTDRAEFHRAIDGAIPLSVGLSRPVMVIAPLDLIRLKIRSGSHESRDPMKRLQDRADALRIVADHPGLEADLSDEGRGTLATWRAS